MIDEKFVNIKIKESDLRTLLFGILSLKYSYDTEYINAKKENKSFDFILDKKRKSLYWGVMYDKLQLQLDEFCIKNINDFL